VQVHKMQIYDGCNIWRLSTQMQISPKFTVTCMPVTFMTSIWVPEFVVEMGSWRHYLIMSVRPHDPIVCRHCTAAFKSLLRSNAVTDSLCHFCNLYLEQDSCSKQNFFSHPIFSWNVMHDLPLRIQKLHKEGLSCAIRAQKRNRRCGY
jgi:hypothetical protein